jgi:hypothetical protein
VDAHHTAARTFAWGGAVLFAAALVYFLFSYAVTFGEIVPGEAELPAILIDTALFSVFALHHSVFARGPVRAFVQSRVPAHLERSVYVWAASLMLIAVCALWRAVPGALWQLQAPWSWVMVVVQLAGIWLTVRAAVVIDPLDLAGLRWTPAVKRLEFRAAGPYGWVRHPIYLGWILIVFGVGTMTMTRLVFAVVSSAYILMAIPLEERTIRASSDGAYEDYMRRVPSKLIPWVH